MISCLIVPVILIDVESNNRKNLPDNLIDNLLRTRYIALDIYSESLFYTLSEIWCLEFDELEWHLF